MFQLSSRCSYCMAVFPAGEDVKLKNYLKNKKGFIERILKPLRDCKEPVYVTWPDPIYETMKGTDMKDPLFEPIRINHLLIKNRICLPAMHLNMAQHFEITDQIIDFYAERARGGAGFIVVGMALIDELSGGPMCIGAHEDRFIPGLSRLAQAIHNGGACSAVQINHSGRYAHSILLDGKKAVAPSAIASNLTREVPRALEIHEIIELVNNFTKAAVRVKKAGFDAVEVLSGTGYLVSEFLSPLTNKRDDEYGGSLENRMRFGLEILQSIRQAVGDDYPVLVRMDDNDFMEGGQKREEMQEYARQLVKIGVNALCIKGSWHEARVPQLTTNVPRGTYGYLARDIKNIVDVPVIASHRINDPAIARELIADGMCDMVAMARSLIADPCLPEKAKAGKEHEIIHCVACAQGCFDHLFKLKSVECLCNPRAGRERETVIQKAESPKRVMVIGGGAAGMNAALAAHERGHEVTLFEQTDRLGGQLYLSAAPPGREEFGQLANDLDYQVRSKNIRIFLNTPVDESLIEKEQPDAVILATGAVPLVPPISGVHLPHVVQAWDVLSGKSFTGKRVVVIGGGAVGVETALFLAERGTLSGEAVKFLLVNKAEDPDFIYELATRGTKEVILIEMIGEIGRDIGKSTRWTMVQEMQRHRIEIRTQTKALEITPSGVMVSTDGKVEIIPADSVVLASGAKSNNPLQPFLEKGGVPFHVAGDAGKIGLAFDAVHQGYFVGSAIGK